MSRGRGARSATPDRVGDTGGGDPIADDRTAVLAEDPAPVVSEDDRWRLEDEREFLVRSIEDAEREHGVGDLSDGDLRVLRRRDESRLEEVEQALALLDLDETRGADAAGETTGGPGAIGTTRGTDAPATDAPATEALETTTISPTTRRPRRWWLVGAGVAAIVAGIVLLAIHLASPQLPGQSISGTVELNQAQEIQRELTQAATLVNQGSTSSISEALTIYRRILGQAPNQPQALAETGWLEWTAGAVADEPTLVGEGKALVEKSLKVKADDYAAHFYLGTMLLKQGDAAGAVTQYRLFLGQGPPAAEVTREAPLIRQAFSDAKQPLPAGVPTS